MMMEKSNDSIQHYESEYYDPAKAHEYYLRKRQLKGRTTRSMSDKQKEAWTYAKDNITEKKKLKMEELRTQAKEARERISQKLGKYSSASSEERKQIRDSLKAAIEAIRAEYESIYQKEYDKILSGIKGKKSKKKKKS